MYLNEAIVESYTACYTACYTAWCATSANSATTRMPVKENDKLIQIRKSALPEHRFIPIETSGL